MDPTVYATLRRKQRRLARENPGVLMAVARGANQAIAECQHQFRNRRWNCSTKNFLRGKNLFGKIVDRGEHRISFLFLRCFFIPRPIIWFVNCRSKIISAARASLIDIERYIRIPSFLAILEKLANIFAKAEFLFLLHFISFYFLLPRISPRLPLGLELRRIEIRDKTAHIYTCITDHKVDSFHVPKKQPIVRGRLRQPVFPIEIYRRRGFEEGGWEKDEKDEQRILEFRGPTNSPSDRALSIIVCYRFGSWPVERKKIFAWLYRFGDIVIISKQREFTELTLLTLLYKVIEFQRDNIVSRSIREAP